MRPLLLIAASAACLLAAAAPSLSGEAAKPAAAPAPASARPSGVQPEALQALEKMAAHLRALQSFEVQADTLIDEVDDQGRKLQFAGKLTYKVRKPDRFVASISTDRKVRTLYYDGRSLTLYAPRMGFFAKVDAPPTIRQALQDIEDRYDIELPLVDLFRWGMPDDRHDDLTEGFKVGYARIGDIETDHYAFSEDDVDWQVWIARGDRPVPVKIVITTLDEREQPQFAATLDWTSNPALPDEAFAFNAPPTARAITLAVVDQTQ